MEFKRLLLIIISAFTLASCTVWKRDVSNIPSDTDQDVNEDTDKPKNGHFYGGLVEGNKFSGYEFSKSTKEIKKPSSGKGIVNIFGINDFHGAIKSDNSHIGLAKLGSIAKEETAKENTLFLDQGDTWQGSLESNANYGALIQDVYNYAGVTLRTVGNHDFDWGVDKLLATSNRQYNETYIPSLASNVFDYDWNTRTVGRNQQKSIGKDYATYVLDNGIKVGVVGVIGNDQITSICTQFVKNITFTNHNERIKEVSDFLRVEKKCDIVIASVHAYAYQCDEEGLTKYSPVSNEKYVDLVLNGHSHSMADWTTNGVHFIQWDSDGQSFGKVELTYDFSRKRVTSSSPKTFYADSINYAYPSNDVTIQTMVDDYLTQVSSKGTEILSSKFSGSFSAQEQLPNLMAKAIFEEAKIEGYNIDYSVVNPARFDITTTTVTYSDLYRSFPFDNEIIIMSVTGYTCARSIVYNYTYHDDESKNSAYANSTYTIACLDYVALHCDTDRLYDNFPGAVEMSKLMKNGEPYTYREILKDYLIRHKTDSFNSRDYWNSLWNFCVSYN